METSDQIDNSRYVCGGTNCEWGQRQRISASNAMEILLLPILLLLLVSDAYFDGDDGSDGYDDANPQHKQVTHLTSLSDSVCYYASAAVSGNMRVVWMSWMFH